MATRMTTQPERRRAPRVADRVAVSIVNPREVIRAETKDLSTSGAYCSLDRFIPLMTKLQLAFSLPTASQPIRCEGVVVRVLPQTEQPGRNIYEVAVFFTEVSDADRNALNAFVQQRLQALS